MPILRIEVTNSFDGSTLLSSANAKLFKDPDYVNTYYLAQPDGSPLDDVGLIPWSLLFASGFFPLPAAYVRRFGHNGGASVTMLSASIADADGGNGVVRMSDLLTVDPAAGSPSSGPLALVEQDDMLALRSDKLGAQVVVLQIVPMTPSAIIDTDGDSNTPDVASDEILLTLFLANTLSSDTAKYSVRWVGPSAELIEASVVANDAVATDDLKVALAIGANPVGNGEITVPVGAAGSSGTATPSSDNVITKNQILSATVGGGNTTASSTGCLLLRFRRLDGASSGPPGPGPGPGPN